MRQAKFSSFKGRVVEDAPSLRDLVVHFGAGAYILRYRIDPDAVVIARIWHSREERGLDH